MTVLSVRPKTGAEAVVQFRALVKKKKPRKEARDMLLAGAVCEQEYGGPFYF